ncbi:MAG: beta-ketoacyl synthase N-terminal-like domain-containing protein [Ferruginibacter sp.]
MQTVYVVDVVRTPIGKYGGALSGIRPDDLLAHVIRALIQRNPSLDVHIIEDVIAGAANQSGEDNRNVARMAALLAGLPSTVGGNTVNRLCASGLQAIMDAARTIAAGDAQAMIACGVETRLRAHPSQTMMPSPTFANPASTRMPNSHRWPRKSANSLPPSPSSQPTKKTSQRIPTQQELQSRASPH